VQPKKTQVVLASTHDSVGRAVVLTQDRWWDHIVYGHPEMEGLEFAVMRAVESADTSCPGRRPGRMELYARGLGPARWMAVIVDYSDSPAWVVTAHPVKKPRGAP